MLGVLKQLSEATLHDDAPRALMRIQMVGGRILFIAATAGIRNECRVLIGEPSTEVGVIIAHRCGRKGEGGSADSMGHQRVQLGIHPLRSLPKTSADLLLRRGKWGGRTARRDALLEPWQQRGEVAEER